MSLSTKKPKAPQVPEDQHIALVAQIIDLGNHFKTDFQTDEIETYDDGNPRINHEVWVTFEFPLVKHVFDEDKGPQPLWVSKRYTVSTHEKAKLTELLAACSIEDGDLSKAAGQVVVVNTGMTSGGNAKVTSVSKAKPNFLYADEVVKTKELALQSDPVVYEIEDGHTETYEGLPQFLKDDIDNQDTKEKFFENEDQSESEQY